MKAAFSNSVLAVVLSLACSSGLRAQESQSPTPSQPPVATQPQNDPTQPSQTPQQEPPKEQPQVQPPSTAQPQSEPGQGTPDQHTPTGKPQTQSQQQTPQTPPSTQSSTSESSKPRTTAKPKSTRRKRTTPSKTQSTTQDGKVVVRNGGTSDRTPQISPGVNDQQAQQQRSVTNQLLVTTDANLKKVTGKQLTPAQQSMLDQVNSYVRQSKAASDAGDISRAHTLALKAQLLSNELARK
jgi:hypothetical protein